MDADGVTEELVTVFDVGLFEIDGVTGAVSELPVVDIDGVVLDAVQKDGVFLHLTDDLDLSGSSAPTEECGDQKKEKYG